jgi:MFS family permease
MDRLRRFRDGLTDKSLRFAILAGLATVPVTVSLSWEPVADGSTVAGVSVSGTPLLMAALVVEYVYGRRETETTARRAGIWTGLAGSLATVILTVANTITTIGATSTTIAALTVATTPFVLALGVGLTVFVTAVAAAVAGWVTTRASPEYRVRAAADDVDRNAFESKWWLPVGAYAVLAPPVFAGFVLEPDGAGLLIFALSMIGLTFLSLPAFAGLFVDATAPRPASAWLPRLTIYAGAPPGAAAIAYAGAALLTVPDPSALAALVFLAALWATVTVYLVNRYRHRDTVPPGPRLAA